MSAGGAAAATAAMVPDAKSIICTECNKVFRNTQMATFHAEKSGHESFEESTVEIAPLTEDEKKSKLEELRVKMMAKKAVKAKEQIAEDKANEQIRRKAGQSSGEMKEALQLKELEKEAMQRKKGQSIPWSSPMHADIPHRQDR